MWGPSPALEVSSLLLSAAGSIVLSIPAMNTRKEVLAMLLLKKRRAGGLWSVTQARRCDVLILLGFSVFSHVFSSF